MGNLLEKCDIELSESVIPALVPFTMLSSLEIKRIRKALTVDVTLNSKLLASKALKLLKKYFDNPGPLVTAFTFLESTLSEEIVNVYCLVAALCFYSKSSPFRKAKCKIYLVLFNLFVNDRSTTMRLKELTKLIKSIILGTRHMTGQDLPNSQIYRVLAEEFLLLADYKCIKRINFEE